MIRYLFVLLFALASFQVNAAHIVGANIQYECIGGNTYKVILNVFRNCDDPILLPPTTTVGISHDCSSYTGNQLLTLVSETEVSQLCAEDLAESSCNGSGQFPGVTLYRYEGEITIDNAPGEYRISWNGSGFRSETLNLDNTDNNETLNIFASIFKTGNECNNSAKLSNLWAPYFCINEQVNFNFGATDPDQDSLSYSFSPAQQNGGFCSNDLDYDPGYSGDEPIPGISVDPLTGQITFIPTGSIGAYTVVLRIDEHRDNILVGSTFIDIQFKVLLCNLPPPIGSSVGIYNFSGSATLASQQEITMCTGDNFCFDYTFLSPVMDAVMEVDDNLSGLFPSATISTSGTNPITITVCYTAEADDIGGVMILNIFDDNCPISGISSMSVLVNVSNSLSAGEDQIICPGESASLNATGDPLIQWESISGDPIIVGTNFSCINCPNPVASPTTTTTYVATSLTSGLSCNATDTMTVHVGLAVDIASQEETCAEGDGFITIEVLGGSGDYDLQINNVPILFDNTYEVSNIDDGDFIISIVDNQSNCPFDTLITLAPFSVPLANAGSDITVCGLNSTLEAIPSSGTGLWTSTSSDVVFEDATDPNTNVSSNTFGDYTLTWTETNGGPDCSSTDNVLISFIDAPTINAGVDDQICGLQYELNATSTGNNGLWQSAVGITFNNPTDPNTTILGSTSGIYDLVWSEDNGLNCIVTDTVTITLVAIPSPDAGSGGQVCSLTKTLNATPSVGIGHWEGSSNLSFVDITDPLTDVTSTIEGAYQVTWVENNEGCSQADSVEVIFTEQPIAFAGIDTALCGVTIHLQAEPSYGTGTWSSNDAGAVFSDINDPLSEVVVSGFSDFSFTWTEDNTGGCISSDDVSISFITSPIANAGVGDSICGLGSIDLQAIPTNGSGQWSYPSEISTTDPSNPQSTFTSNTYGVFDITWTESDLNCSTEDVVTIGFLEEPVANAGVDFNICGLTTTLSAIGSAGIGTWSGVDSTLLSDIHDPNATIEVPDFGAYTLIWLEENSFCTSQDDVMLNFLSNSTPYAGEDDSTCTDSYILNATPISSGIWIAPDLVASGILDATDLNNPNATLTFQPGNYGTFSLIWYDNTCDAGDEVLLTYLETPNTQAGLDMTNCGLEVTMNAIDNEYNGVWTIPTNAAIDDLQSSTANIAVPAAGQYQFIWEETNIFCVNSDTILIDFVDIPQPTIGPDDFTCGLNLTVTVVPDGINGQWEPNANVSYIPDANAPTVNVNALDYGSQELVWTEVDPTGNCIGSDTVMIVFDNPPDTTNFNIECINLNAQYVVTFNIINGDQGSYEVVGNGNLTGNTYVSEPIDTYDSYSFSINDNFDCDPLILSDVYGCPSLTDAGALNMDTLFICTNEIANVSITETAFLDGDDVLLYVIHTNPDTTLGNILAENYFAPEFEYNTVFTPGTVYYLSAVAGNSLPNGLIDLTDPNLSVSYGVPVLFAPPPELLINLDMVEACLDQNAVIDYSLNGFPSWVLSYTFNGEDTLITNIQNAGNNNLVFDESGWIYLNSISNQYCTTEINDSIQVIVHDNPTVAMENLYQFCTNEDYLVDIELTGDGPWSFLFLHVENPLSLLDTVVTSASIQIPVTEAGNYYITSLLDQNCPTVEGNIPTVVELLETPESLAGADQEICFGESASLGEENEIGLLYEWTNGQWLSDSLQSTPVATIDVDTNMVVTYPFVLTTSNSNCSVLDTVEIMVRPLPHNYQVDSIAPFCQGEDITLGVVGPYDFVWTPAEGLSDSTIHNPVVSTFTSTSYTVIAEDNYGCIDSTVVPLNVLESPYVLIAPSVLSGCLPLEVDFINNTTIQPGDICLWTFTDNDEYISESCDDISLVFNETGEYNISLRVINDEGCIGQASLDTSIVASEIVANFGYSPEQPHIDFPSIQFTSQAPEAINWTWTIDNSILLDEPSPLLDTDSLGAGIHEVCLQVINQEGCISEICKNIEISEDPFLWVPNAFTPNNDNLNEVFRPVLSNDYLVEKYDLFIYNRLGREIYHTDNIDNTWGSNLLKERKRPIGNYVWLIKLKLTNLDEPLIYTGQVTVIK